MAVAARSLGGLDDDVTLPQYRALVVLAVHGDQHVGQLAEALDVHPSTMTRMCDRLVRKGLVTRRRSAGSRRATTISLSPAGQAVVDQVVAARRREIRRIVRRIPAEARTAANSPGDATSKQVTPAFASVSSTMGSLLVFTA